MSHNKTWKQKVRLDRARHKLWRRIKAMWTGVILMDDNGRKFEIEFCDN